MNNKYLFLILCIYLANGISAQFEASITRCGLIGGIDVSVNLLKSRQYFIALEFIGDGDSDYEYGLSAGNYIYHQDTLILTDTYYNYSLKFLRKDDELFPVRSFPWMKSKLTMNDTECGETYKNTSNIINHYKPLLFHENNEYYKLFYGKYEYNDRSIILKKGNYYICRIYDLIVSEGEFTYNGRYIRFNDKYLGFSFIGTVRQNNVCIGFFPFENSCLEIRK